MITWIAYDIEGNVIDIVGTARPADLAAFEEQKKLVNAYWQGKEIYPYSSRTISNKTFRDHPTGIIPILSTKEANFKDLTSGS